MKRIVECVPNFSEGRDKEVVNRIVTAIREAEAGGLRVQVLHVDAGEAANRTVVTFMGEAEAVCEAAFQGVRTAADLIDMRQQHGTHPRIGATDVLPLVPISGFTLEECAVLARKLAERIYKELGIPCYCYEAAAFRPERRNLAVCRAGEYESLPEKMEDPLRRPDFGPPHYDERTARTGATVVGARDILIAVNFNLEAPSKGTDCKGEVLLAQEIACDVREKGRKVNGEWVRGTLKGCKAIGWYIEEYGIAQVSMNITDIHATPLHKAYEEVCRAAAARGTRITGTEIIGLVPRSVLEEAGRYFLRQQACKSTGQSFIQAAIKAMHLDDLCPFDVEKKTF